MKEKVIFNDNGISLIAEEIKITSKQIVKEKEE